MVWKKQNNLVSDSFLDENTLLMAVVGEELLDCLKLIGKWKFTQITTLYS